MSEGQKALTGDLAVARQIVDLRFRLIHLQLVVENFINRNKGNSFVILPSQGEITALEEKAVDMLARLYPGMVEKKTVTPEQLQEALTESISDSNQTS